MFRPIKISNISVDPPLEIVKAEEDVITIGRELDNGIVVETDLVSRRHAALYACGAEWVFRDLGSTNGSWLNGTETEPGIAYLLRDLDIIRVSNLALRFNEEEDLEEKEKAVSILIFSGDNYEREVKFSTAEPKITFGGESSDCVIRSIAAGVVIASFELVDGVLHFVKAPFETACPMFYGSSAIESSFQLKDRDSLSIGEYQLIISDRVRPSYYKVSVFAEEENDSVPKVHGGLHPDEDLIKKQAEQGWQSQSAKRRSKSNKVFVFNEENEVNSKEQKGELSQKIITGIGLFLFALVILFALYILITKLL